MTQLPAVSANTVATATPEFLSQGKLATKLLGLCRVKEEQCQEVSVCHSHSSRTQTTASRRPIHLSDRQNQRER